MSLTALNARMTVQNLVAVGSPNNPNLVLDGIYNLLTNAGGAFPNYADGTARSPGTYADEVIGVGSPVVVRGTGSAWTWSKEQVAGVTVAIIGASPSTSTAFCQNTRIVIAGNAAGTLPKAAGGDTNSPAQLWIGLVKNVVAGATYNGWSNATPWTGCQFGGFVNFGFVTTDAKFNTSTRIRIIETQETCWFQVTTGATSQYSIGGYAGGMVDPETTNPADAESDGRLYVYGSSGTVEMANNILFATTGFSMILFDPGSGAGYPHTLSYNPGLATTQICARIVNSNASTLNLVTRAGDFPRIGFYASNPSNWAGRWREVQIVRDGLSQQTFSTGATINGFTFGYNPNLTGDCVLLQY